MPQADKAGSTRPGAASPGKIVHLSTTRRAVLAAALAVPAAVTLTPSSWREHFDAATWVERWQRAGHTIRYAADGHPLLMQRMDGDEAHAAAMRAEIGYPGNRQRLLGYLAAARA